jgi:hypothetical protein
MVCESWYTLYQFPDAVERSSQDGNDQLGIGLAND